MSVETRYHNGSDTRSDVDQMQKALLKKLEQQNRILEEDKHSCTRIMSHSGSNASFTEDSSSLHSVESNSSPCSPPSEQPTHVPNKDSKSTAAVEVNSVTTSSVSDQSSHSNDPVCMNQAVSPSRESEQTQHEDSLSPAPSVESPTEVKSKPLPYFPSTEDLYEEDPGYYDRDEGLGESALGPGVSVVLDDEYGTTIDYNEVVPQEDDCESGGDYELHEEEEEVPQTNTQNSNNNTTPQSSQGSLHSLTQQQENKMDAEKNDSPTKTLSPTEETETRSLSPVIKVGVQMTTPSTGDVVLGSAKEEKLLNENEQLEEKDTVPDLLNTVIGSKGTPPLWKRPRSETDLYTGNKVSLASLVARKRTLTTVDSKLTNEEKLPPVEEKSKEQREEDLWLQWSNLLKNWEENAKKNQKLVKQLARQGIPEHLRGMAWQLLSDSHNPELKEQYPSLITEVSPFERAIQRDLARTFPEHSFFKEKDGLGQESLFNVLKAYSIYDREVGYCQGSPFITGLLLMQMPEEDAFCVFVSLMKNYKLRELFKPSMADLSLCFYQLEKLVEELFPSLYIHFKAVGFQTSMYASPWFLTMFASVLSMNVVHRVMDVFMVEGREVIFRVGLALLEYSMDRLVQLDMEDMLKHFQKEIKQLHEGDPNQLMQRAFKIKYNPKKLKKLEKEYMYKKEKQANENKEVIRLQNENDELTQRLILLEKECASLADRLIQGQVTRAQEAEEMFVVKKELSKMRRRVMELETDGKPVSPETLEGHNVDEQQDESAVTCGLQQEEGQFTDQLIGKDKKEGKKNKKRQKSQTSLSSDGEKEKELKKEKLKKEIHRTRSSSMELDSPVSLPTSPAPKLSKKEKKRKKAELIGELALVKTQCADVANQLEQKSLDLKQALQRESFVIRELRAAREYVTCLEQKLSEVKMEKMSCPECGFKLAQSQRSDTGSSTNSLMSANSGSPAHPQSSDVLLSQLRALRNTKPSTVDDLDSPVSLSNT